MKKSKWTRAQIDLLIEKTKKGNVRMHAFEEVAKQTRRKANSVRNYYYKNLAKEKTAFAAFSVSEVAQVLREIVLGTSRGESVRSICMRLACGDKLKMLRFQNKYRAILRTAPQQIIEIKNTLEGQGYLVKLPSQTKLPYQPSFFDKANLSTSPEALGLSAHHNLPNNVVTLPQRESKKVTDSDITNLFMGLVRLVKKQAEDSAKSQIDMLKAEIERLKPRVSSGSDIKRKPL